MDRNENFPALLVSALTARLAWASLQVTVENIDHIQVFVSGDDAGVRDLRVELRESRLMITQPTFGLSLRSLTARGWMQIVLRLPLSWKGAVDLHTISAPLQLSGVTGTDLYVASVSGSVLAQDLQSITTTLRTASGDIRAERIHGGSLRLRTLSGDVSALACGFDAYRLTTALGQIDLDMIRPFEKLSGLSVSGGMRLFAPVAAANAVLRTVSGKLRTRGISIMPEGPDARVLSISGNLEINCSTAATDDEEE